MDTFWNRKIKRRTKERNLSLDEFLIKIKIYLSNIIINLQNSDAWKNQITIAINFISSKDANEEHVMHSASDIIIFIPSGDANEVADDLFELPRSKISSKYKNINDRKWFYFWFSSTNVLQMP